MIKGERLAAAEDDRALDLVGQFPDIAGPAVGKKATATRGAR